MTVAQLIGAIGGDDRDPIAPRVANQERQQIARGRIDPVHVLDDQRHHPLFRQPHEHPIHRLKQLLPPTGHAPARARDRPQRRKRRPQRILQPLQRSTVLHHPTQCCDDRRERQLTLRKLHTLADQDNRTTRLYRASSSDTSRLFPIPASPAIRTAVPVPDDARATARCRTSNSATRPTNRGDEIRPTISPTREAD